MNDPLALMMRNADPELAGKFLQKHKAPNLDLSGDQKIRNEQIAIYLSGLRETNDKISARMAFGARRIEALNHARNDRRFTEIIDKDACKNFKKYTQRDKALWLWIYKGDAFDELERDVALEQLQSRRNRRAVFQTDKQCSADNSPPAIDKYREALKQIYAKHDGSGEFVTAYPPRSKDESPTLEYAFSLSQSYRHLERYSDDGTTQDDLFRGVTWVSISYDPKDGALKICASRGGFGVREQIAETFAKILLGVDSPPTLSPESRVDLMPVMRRKELQPLPNQDSAKTKRIEIRLLNQSKLPGTQFTLKDKNGLPSDILRQLFGEHEKSAFIQYIKIKITNYVPAGSQKSVTVALTLHADGTLSYGGAPVDRDILEDSVHNTWLAGK